jgi:tRNA1Val (adenine37-N6)-methyltransferase
MAKGFFQFKQFTIAQDQCAMKVCTDACYFGAWLASLPDPECQVLDIGTGTGLLSLMLAQAWPKSTFLALEIDPEAAKQANENFQQSPWEERLKVKHTSLQEFLQQSQQTFSCIISNPPFYENRLSGPNRKKNIAHHGEGLLQEDLLLGVRKLLNKEGHSYLLYPLVEADSFQSLAEKQGMSIQVKSQLQDRAEAPIIRKVISISHKKNPKEETEIPTIMVKNKSGQFSEGFASLLKEYYIVF